MWPRGLWMQCSCVLHSPPLAYLFSRFSVRVYRFQYSTQALHVSLDASVCLRFLTYIHDYPLWLNGLDLMKLERTNGDSDTTKTGVHTVKMGSYSSITMCQYWDNLLSSILTIILTCPNNNTLLCYSNEPFLTVNVRTNLHAITLSLPPSEAVELLGISRDRWHLYMNIRRGRARAFGKCADFGVLSGQLNILYVQSVLWYPLV